MCVCLCVCVCLCGKEGVGWEKRKVMGDGKGEGTERYRKEDQV